MLQEENCIVFDLFFCLYHLYILHSFHLETSYFGFDDVLLLGQLILVSAPSRFEGKVFVLLTKTVGVLQRLRQLGSDSLGEEGGGHGPREADHEQSQVGIAQVLGSKSDGVGSTDAAIGQY